MLALADATGNALLTVQAATFSDLLRHATLSTANKLTLTDASPEKLKVTITPGTGLFTGSFIPPGASKPITLSGAIDQQHLLGAGLFKLPTGQGSIVIQPATP